MKKLLVDKTYTLQKFPGKGGWTYAAIPEVKQDKAAHFGWVTINGSIDDFELKNTKLMPMGNGFLFLSVNAGIRKAIGKKEGDTVNIKIFDDFPENSIEDIIDCIREEPEAYEYFLSLNQAQQNEYLDWINTATNEDFKVKRIVKVLDNLLMKRTFSDLF